MNALESRSLGRSVSWSLGLSATGFLLLLLFYADPACGLHNPHTQHTLKTGLRSALIRFWGMTNAFQIKIGDLIGPLTNGLKCDDNKLIS